MKYLKWILAGIGGLVVGAAVAPYVLHLIILIFGLTFFLMFVTMRKETRKR